MSGSWRLRCTHCGGEIPLSSEATTDAACRTCGARVFVRAGIVGITAPAENDADYPEALVDLVCQVEDRHFWFAARNQVIVSTMRRLTGSLVGKRALDVGCGTGFVLAALESAGIDAGGIDMHRGSLLRARARMRGPLFWNNAAALPFFPDFDFVTLCDVIEHVDRDEDILREAASVLKPNGFVVVTVPAGPDLWTSYDEASGHKRRYTRAGLASVLERSGFAVRYVGYFNFLPLVAQVLHRTVTSKTGTLDPVAIVRAALRVPPEPLNTLFRALIRAEAPLRALPWLRGGSLIAIGERTS